MANLAPQQDRYDFKPEISLIHLATLQYKVFYSLKTPQPINLVEMEAGDGCCKLPLKAAEEDDEEIQEVTASLATEISLDASTAVVLLELDGIFLTEEQRTALIPFSIVKMFFALIPTYFWNDFS